MTGRRRFARSVRGVDPDVDLRALAQRSELDGVFVAAVASGGVLGAEARYGIGSLWPLPGSGFPWATLCINGSGCLLIGVLMVLISEVVDRPHRLLRPFLGVGVLGGFTTFSTYAVDVVAVADAGRIAVAGAYVVLTSVVALAAVWVGVSATRWLSLRHR